jgi:hypothetical protein
VTQPVRFQIPAPASLSFTLSPDGRFEAGGKLKKVDASGGLPQIICDLQMTHAVGGA